MSNPHSSLRLHKDLIPTTNTCLTGDLDDDSKRMLEFEFEEGLISVQQYGAMHEAYKNLKSKLGVKPAIQNLLHFYDLTPLKRVQRHLKENPAQHP
eukprot:CAMPEP_0176448490 /NCGR_PEP_ID=MMETSP0127-20121128/25816_1 /TAXON_ID=938130 /ORGANISM="Platyophrya macrostoma, Strain WH" /LENGTH=95 /DNA_ID=CAMNT_0017835453 /DNA_START=12 /DNA_END=299 /DNA_ORIENTATION=+